MVLMRLCCGCLAAAAAATPLNVQFSVDVTTAVRPISLYIYGVNGDSITAADGVTLDRLGGNRLTGYNWENNASNAGTDYLNESDNYLGGGLTPGKVVTDFVDQDNAAGIKSLVTVQAAGYVAADKNGVVSTAETAPSPRWKTVVFQKGSAFATTPDTSDTAVYMDEFVNFLMQKYGPTSGTGGVWAYDIDNEPTLWPSTHPRIHPKQTGAAEVAEKNAALARAVKQVDASAQIFGGVFYGYNAYQNAQNAPDWSALQKQGNYGWYLDYFLDQMSKASAAAGMRLLDDLDLHWYPEATGINRITTDSITPQDVAARLQAPRSLWDSTYVETSWITQDLTTKPGGAPGPIDLLPHIFASIDQYFPGTKVSISEYNYGAPGHVSGGLAMADFLGIAGRMGVYAACYWPQSNGKYPNAAIRIFRNYDGQKANFGSLSAQAVTSNQDSTSVYAGFDAGGNVIHILALNKSQSVVHGSFAVTSPVGITQGRVFGFDSTSAVVAETTAVAAVTQNQFTYDLPPYSARLFALQTAGSLGLRWSVHLSDAEAPRLSPAGELLGLPARFQVSGALRAAGVDGRMWNLKPVP